MSLQLSELRDGSDMSGNMQKIVQDIVHTKLYIAEVQQMLDKFEAKQQNEEGKKMLNDFNMEGSSMFPNIVTFNANSGVWKLRQDGETNEVQMPKQVVMDLAVFTKGWNLILKGQAPQANMVSTTNRFLLNLVRNLRKHFVSVCMLKTLDYVSLVLTVQWLVKRYKNSSILI